MIPNKIYQTYKSYDLSNELKKLIKNTIDINQEFEYVFMDNHECLNFIETNFDNKFVEMYKTLPLDIMRADVWRVAVIYIYGGIYCDIDVLFKKSVNPLLKNEELVVFTEKGGGISNFFFGAKPKHPSLKLVLDLFVNNQHTARDTNSDLLVQDFGMALFHEVIS
jgi:mannosyltransferase OCH1-like enzyme